MKIKNLPKEEKEAIDKAFKQSKLAREQNRIQVIRLLTKGYKYKEVEEATGLSTRTLEELVSKYNKEGIAGLKLKPHPRNNSRLSIQQKDTIKEILNKFDSPSKSGIKVSAEEDYWSVITVKQLIKKKYKIEYKSLETYRGLLRYCGYSYQKVEFEDERKSNEQTVDFKKRFSGKLKKGGFSMWW